MVIREYQAEDCKELMDLFYNTVHTVNAKDYTKEQLDVWATGQADLEKWNQSFQKHYSLVAVWDKVIAGFGDMDKTGYLDRLYVHKDYQRKGIATAICDQLERAASGKIITHASITARPFFEKRGYTVVREQQIEREGIALTNFVMEKQGALDEVMQLCRKIVEYIQEGDYASLVRDHALCRVSEQDIRRVLGEYGGSVTAIPKEAFHSNAYDVYTYRDGSGYHVDLDLWIDGGRSDLTLQVEINVDEHNEICDYHILDLLVM